jgi:hypothetical protein
MIVQVDLRRGQTESLISFFSHKLIKFLSKNTNHYKLDLILRSDFSKDNFIGQKMSCSSQESKDQTFDYDIDNVVFYGMFLLLRILIDFGHNIIFLEN